MGVGAGTGATTGTRLLPTTGVVVEARNWTVVVKGVTWTADGKHVLTVYPPVQAADGELVEVDRHNVRGITDAFRRFSAT